MVGRMIRESHILQCEQCFLHLLPAVAQVVSDIRVPALELNVFIN